MHTLDASINTGLDGLLPGRCMRATACAATAGARPVDQTNDRLLGLGCRRVDMPGEAWTCGVIRCCREMCTASSASSSDDIAISLP